jgi:hypothetical protein
LAMASCGGGSSREATAIEDTIRGYLTTFNAGDFTQCLTYFTGYEDEDDALAVSIIYKKPLGSTRVASK